MTTTINELPWEVLRFEVMAFASEKNLSFVSKWFRMLNINFEERQLRKFYQNRTIELLCPKLMGKAKGALEEENYDDELKLLKKIRCKIFSILESHNSSKYNKLNETYGKGSISHKKVFEAAEELRPLIGDNLKKIWGRIREELIKNNIPYHNIPNENASAQDIRAWLNNPENQEAINSITKLNLGDLGLTILPPEIGKLTALKNLCLHFNKLTTLPETIGNLTALEFLLLYYNKLTTLPETIGNLIALKALYLHRNKLTTLPESICNLTALQELSLFHNQLTTLPESIGNLTALQELYLKFNKLTKLPKSIVKLTAEITMDSKVKKIYKKLKNKILFLRIFAPRLKFLLKNF